MSAWWSVGNSSKLEPQSTFKPTKLHRCVQTQLTISLRLPCWPKLTLHHLKHNCHLYIQLTLTLLYYVSICIFTLFQRISKKKRTENMMTHLYIFSSQGTLFLGGAVNLAFCCKYAKLLHLSYYSNYPNKDIIFSF